jgi:hypothetical protein
MICRTLVCSCTLRATIRASSAARPRSSLVDVRNRVISTSTSTLKSKSSFASEPTPPTIGDVPVINTKGKGPQGASKGPKGTPTKKGNVERSQIDDDRRYTSSTENQEMPGEKFEMGNSQSNMQRAVQRCKDTISKKVASYGRADPCEFILRAVGRKSFR